MSTTTKELLSLIKKVEAKGATVEIEYDMEALIEEGRSIIESVKITGLKGCGPFAMSPISAAERMRELVV